jgi:hypothetical protein
VIAHTTDTTTTADHAETARANGSDRGRARPYEIGVKAEIDVAMIAITTMTAIGRGLALMIAPHHAPAVMTET